MRKIFKKGGGQSIHLVYLILRRHVLSIKLENIDGPRAKFANS